MGLHQTKRLLQSKGKNQDSEEAMYRINQIFSNYISDKWLVVIIYNELQKLDCKTVKIIQL
jgi:hypothetical protein